MSKFDRIMVVVLVAVFSVLSIYAAFVIDIAFLDKENLHASSRNSSSVCGTTMVRIGDPVLTGVQGTNRSGEGQSRSDPQPKPTASELENPHAKSDADDHGKGKGDKK